MSVPVRTEPAFEAESRSRAGARHDAFLLLSGSHDQDVVVVRWHVILLFC